MSNEITNIDNSTSYTFSFFCCEDGKTFDLIIPSNCQTILQLKQHLETVKGYPTHTFKLMFREKDMEDSTNLDSLITHTSSSYFFIKRNDPRKETVGEDDEMYKYYQDVNDLLRTITNTLTTHKYSPKISSIWKSLHTTLESLKNKSMPTEESSLDPQYYTLPNFMKLLSDGLGLISVLLTKISSYLSSPQPELNPMVLDCFLKLQKSLSPLSLTIIDLELLFAFPKHFANDIEDDESRYSTSRSLDEEMSVTDQTHTHNNNRNPYIQDQYVTHKDIDDWQEVDNYTQLEDTNKHKKTNYKNQDTNEFPDMPQTVVQRFHMWTDNPHKFFPKLISDSKIRAFSNSYIEGSPTCTKREKEGKHESVQSVFFINWFKTLKTIKYMHDEPVPTDLESSYICFLLQNLTDSIRDNPDYIQQKELYPNISKCMEIIDSSRM